MIGSQCTFRQSASCDYWDSDAGKKMLGRVAAVAMAKGTTFGRGNSRCGGGYAYHGFVLLIRTPEGQLVHRKAEQVWLAPLDPR